MPDIQVVIGRSLLFNSEPYQRMRSSVFSLPKSILTFKMLQMAIMEERWTQMESGNGHGNGHAYAPGGKGAAGGDDGGLPGTVNNQYLARMTQYYTEGNQVSTSSSVSGPLLK